MMHFELWIPVPDGLDLVDHGLRRLRGHELTNGPSTLAA